MTFSLKKSTLFQKCNPLKQWIMLLFKDYCMKSIGWFDYTKRST